MIKKVKARFQEYMAVGRANAERYLADRPHRTLRMTPKANYKKGKPVERVWPLITGTFTLLWRHKGLFGFLLVTCAVVMYVFVGGISQVSFVDLRQATHDVLSGSVGEIGSAAALFTAAVTGSLSPSVGQLQQFLAGLITFLFWLAYIWALRRLLADEPQEVEYRDALYNSGAPIVSSSIVMLTGVVQLMPAVVGVFGASLALSGLWLQGVEVMVVTVAAGLLCLLSFYWVTSTAMAMVIVTLPGMYPWRALAGASVLVIGQRWKIALRLVVLAVVIFLLWVAVLLPLLLLDSWLRFDWLPLIPVAVQLLGALTVLYGTTYIYKMYRSML